MGKAFAKVVYWLDPDEHGVRPKGEAAPQKAPCELLAPGREGRVLPEEWEGFSLCARQVSWVSGSGRENLVLWVSDLPRKTRPPDYLITDSAFAPPALPKEKEARAMAQDPAYLVRRPAAWEAVQDSSAAAWMRTLGLPGRFEGLFTWHCANHANFLEPKFFVTENNRPAPYSIARTRRVCSACMEMFGVVGGDWPVRYVVPCPGAVLFAQMVSGRYYRVSRPEMDEEPVPC
ncbi:MAG: hypothetical protein JRI97_02010 [Deltaproteobacteria bacterium]|nr:hypothetical protein [Deltaproteobacteria bacterium]